MAVWVSDGGAAWLWGRKRERERERAGWSCPTCCQVGVGGGEGVWRGAMKRRPRRPEVTGSPLRELDTEERGHGPPRIRSGGLDCRRHPGFTCVCQSDMRCQSLKGTWWGRRGLPFLYMRTTCQACARTFMHHLFSYY